MVLCTPSWEFCPEAMCCWSSLSGTTTARRRYTKTGIADRQRLPTLLGPPAPAPTYWVHEGNMLVYSTVFRSVGGYDPMLRAHEIQDLAIRLAKIGVKRQFDPSISVTHHHIDVRGRNRRKWETRATIYLIRKHGVVRFLTELPRERDRSSACHRGGS